MFRRQRVLLWSAPFALLAVGGAAYWHMSSGPAHSKRPGLGKVPVTVAAVTRHDVPITLSGLGMVQASFTISIQSQVDGKLIDVPFGEGQRVKKGDVLARIDPSLYQAALDQAVAKKAQDQAQLVAAQKDLDRAKELQLKQVESLQVLDQRQGKVDQLKAMVEADDAEIATARTQLERTTIVAPSDGRLGMRLVDPGNIIRAGDKTPIVTLTDAQPAAVVFTLPARRLEDVREAMAHGPVEVTALDQDNRQALATGTLALIDNMIDQATATIRLKAMFANTDDRLWPGEFVNARALLDTRRGALTVPPHAVQRGPQGLFAWVVGPGDTVQMRPITIGVTADHVTVVTSGLEEGDRVVVDGQLKLRPGSPVAVSPSPGPSVAGRSREHL